MKKGCAFLYGLFCCIFLQAQSVQMVFDHYGYEEGYVSRSSRRIVRTNDGFLWITGGEGLARFDSKVFRFYRHEEGDSSTIAGDITYNITKDKQDRVWVQAGSGLDIFIPATEQFQHCYILDNGQKRQDFWAHSLYYDSLQNRVWVGTSLGLYYSHNGSRQLFPAITDSASVKFGRMVFGCITGGYEGKLWLGNSYGFFSFDPVSGHIIRFHIPDQEPAIENDDGVMSLLAVNKDEIWVGTWTKGLVHYNIRTGSGRHFYYSDHKKENNAIASMTLSHLPDQQDIIWVSAVSRGLGLFNVKTGKFRFYNTAFRKDIRGVKGMTWGLYADAKEGVWIAAEEGLHKFDYSRQVFREYNLAAFNPYFAKADPVDQLCFEQAYSGPERAWVNIPYQGTYIYEFESNTLRAIPGILDSVLMKSGTSVYSLFIDRRNTLWISTDRHGLSSYQIASGKLEADRYSSLFRQPHNWAQVFCEDAEGRLWIGTYKGLYFIDSTRRTCKAVKTLQHELLSAGLSQRISAISMDSKGRVWFVAQEREYKSAFGWYDPVSDRVFLFRPDKDKRLPIAELFHDLVIEKNQLYISSSAGLITADLNTESPVFNRLSSANGLLHNQIIDLQPDASGNIWCAGVFGLSCYRPEKKVFINYSCDAYGLQNTLNTRIAVAHGSGSLFVTQTGSVLSFNSPALSMIPEPRIVFTSLQIFNKEVLGYSQLSEGSTHSFDFSDNSITIRFAALSFSNAAENLYSWRLEGLEEEWHTGRNSTASYNNLSPGRYTLLVKAANSLGVWTNNPARLFIEINPPFWRTWWFILISATAVITLLYLLYQYRISQLIKLQQVRNSISRDLHDEIGSTLTSISILSAVSQQALMQDLDQTKKMLEEIEYQAKTIQQTMSDIVWSIRTDNDYAGSLLTRLREYAAKTLEPLQVTTKIGFDEALISKALPATARKEVLLICKEALNNIAKHAGATEVAIQLLYVNKELELLIRDNGRWKGSSSGSGLISMKLRADKAGGQLNVTGSESGTEVRLKLPLP